MTEKEKVKIFNESLRSVSGLTLYYGKFFGVEDAGKIVKKLEENVGKDFNIWCAVAHLIVKRCEAEGYTKEDSKSIVKWFINPLMVDSVMKIVEMNDMMADRFEKAARFNSIEDALKNTGSGVDSIGEKMETYTNRSEEILAQLKKGEISKNDALKQVEIIEAEVKKLMAEAQEREKVLKSLSKTIDNLQKPKNKKLKKK